MKQISLLKKTSVSVMVLSTLTLAAFAGQGPGGTDIFHYSTKAQMTPPEGALEGPTGRVDIKIREQGKAAKQDLTLRLQGLQESENYQLFLLEAGETSDKATPLLFKTDARGRANLAYRNKAMGKGKAGLPEDLELHQVTSIQVIPDTTAEPMPPAVLTAELGGEGQFHYQVKQTVVSTGGVRGELRILSNASTTQFRLRATGLIPGEYTLDLNGLTETSYPVDETGALVIDAPLNPAPDVLGLETIALTLAGTVDPVLTFNLP